MTTNMKLKTLIAGLAVATCTAGMAQGIPTSANFGAKAQDGATFLYNNSTTYLDAFYPSTTEYGDEIVAGASGTLTTFSLDYYVNFAPTTETAVIRFYAGGAEPTTPLFESASFALTGGLNGFNTVTLNGLSLAPITSGSSYIFTIEFSGIDGAEKAGLLFYDPPTVGSSDAYFWQKDSLGAWQQVTVVPEPSTLLLSGLGLAGLFGYRRFAKKA